jgi:signal transduction histidine kinase
MVYQCWLFAIFTDDRGQITSTSFQDEHCYSSGRFGLKSYYVPTAWRNVVVYQARQTDLEAMQRSIPSPNSASVPDPQDSLDAFNDTRLLAPMQRASHAHMSDADAVPIAQLFLLDPNIEREVVTRGVVTMLRPQLFVQDGTGAVSVADYQSDTPLQIGNAVEVTGFVRRGDYSVSLHGAKVLSMWSHATVLPVPVSATQAAGGAYDKQLIQTEGTLEDLHKEDGDRFVLRIQDGQQQFIAYIHNNGLTKTVENLKKGSRLRLSGICVIDAASVRGNAAFALLMRSFEDVTLVQPPPWWNWTHALGLILAAIFVTFAVQYAVHSVQRIRMHAVIEERQRLAMEMHDSLAQSFAGIGFSLEALCAGTEEGSPLHGQLASTAEMARYGHKEARRNIAAISPGNLESLGLLASLQHAARGIIQDGKIIIETNTSGEPKQLPLHIEDTLLRIGQEAIANAVRHAKPSTILLSVNFGETFVRLAIRDDGVGFRYKADHAGYGILGMKERARAIRARLRIGSSPGRGTIVLVRASLPSAFLRRFSWRGVRLFSRRPKSSKA